MTLLTLQLHELSQLYAWTTETLSRSVSNVEVVGKASLGLFSPQKNP